MKKQINPPTKTYVIAGGFYLMLLAVCAIPFALARQSPANPQRQPRRYQQGTGKPAPRRSFETDESVTWQNNPVHDGYNAASPLVPPLELKWSRDFSASDVDTISYPLIAGGMVFVTTANTNGNYGNTFWALDENTGMTIWSADLPGTYFFADAAYDSGKVFVVSFDGLMKAFDAATGSPLWSVNLLGQYAFTSAPTAVDGIVFVGGAGSGGTVYAVDETNGEVLWTMPVENG